MASTYLTRTPGSAGNLTTWTFSGWFKRLSMGNTTILGCAIDGQNQDLIYFQSDGTLRWWRYGSNDYVGQLKTTRVFRDPSAWYHIVFVWDSSNATADNRMRIYVNGTQETVFTTRLNPPLNTTSLVNTADALAIGRAEADIGTYPYFDGSMAHVHFIDGTAYNADTFGETDSTTGQWKPKTSPSVTYGTNGFFLKFANSGSMGTDSSGNGNNFTVNGTLTQTLDTPSNVFATWNPNLAMNSTMTLANGNLAGTTASNYEANVSNSWFSTLGVSQGKYYAEFKLSAVTGGTGGMVGVAYDLSLAQQGNTVEAYNIAYLSATGGTAYQMDGTIRYNASDLISSLPTYTTGDIIGVALDLDNHKLYFHKNGTYINSGDPTSGATGTGSVRSLETGQEYFFGCSDGSLSNTYTYQANFGNGYFGTTAVSSAQSPSDGIGIFEYAVPSGYKALCTKSINAQEYS